jgi:hypothetical protein
MLTFILFLFGQGESEKKKDLDYSKPFNRWFIQFFKLFLFPLTLVPSPFPC